MTALRVMFLMAVLAALAAVGPVAAATTADASDDEVLVRVGEAVVTRGDVERRIARIHRFAPRMRAGGEAESVDVRGIVRSLVEQALLAQEGRRLGLDRDPRVKAALERFRRALAVTAYRRAKVLDKAAPTDAEVEARLAEHHGEARDMDPAMAERLRRRAAKELERANVARLTADVEQRLRASADIEVDEAALAAVPLDSPVADPGRAVARVDGQVLTAGEVAAEARRDFGMRQGMFRRTHGDEQAAQWIESLKKDAVDHLVVCLLVEREALARGYGDGEDVRRALAGREDSFLAALVEREVIAPLAEPAEERLRAYHAAHPDEFATGRRVRLGRMRLMDQGRAERLRGELMQGADFDYLARVEAVGVADAGAWTDEAALPPALRKAVQGLSVGGVTEVVPVGRAFELAMVKERGGGRPLEFEVCRDNVRRVVMREQYERVRAQYMDKLRARARIDLDETALAALEAGCWAQPGPASETDEEMP